MNKTQYTRLIAFLKSSGYFYHSFMFLGKRQVIVNIEGLPGLEVGQLQNAGDQLRLDTIIGKDINTGQESLKFFLI